MTPAARTISNEEGVHPHREHDTLKLRGNDSLSSSLIMSDLLAAKFCLVKESATL